MKKIYLIPNMLTLSNLVCGYWAITFAIKGSFAQAAMMIYLSILFDMCDGRIARMTNTTSSFGLEFDSLADLISFGLAPAAIVYSCFATQTNLEKVAWWSCFLYLACAALRLARYNVQSNKEEKEDFMGLPTPCAGGFLASYILLVSENGNPPSPWFVLPIMFILAFLMVSSVTYPSFSRADFHKRKRLEYLVLFIVLIGLIVRFPQQVLFCVFFGYIASGFLLKFKKINKAALNEDQTEEE